MKHVSRNSLHHALLFIAALALLAIGNAWSALSADDLLEPEKAFRISTRALDERTVEVRFAIAEGYYMYRDRFKFETGSGKPLADAELPAGVRKTDEFFGETETYRREVLIRVPLSSGDVERGRVSLKVTSQGCSDTGVCYVPLEQIVNVRLPGSASGSLPTAPGGLRAWLAQAWFQAALAAAALAIFALSLRFAPALKGLRGAARAAHWPYPALAFAFAALLAAAASPVLLQEVRDAVWAALLITAAIWLRALDPLPEHARGMMRVGKGLGVIALAAGVVLLAFALGARGLLAFDQSGSEIGAPRVIGYKSAEEFRTVLDSVLRRAGNGGDRR